MKTKLHTRLFNKTTHMLTITKFSIICNPKYTFLYIFRVNYELTLATHKEQVTHASIQ